MRGSGFHPGQQTAVKRLLRELVGEGIIQKEGKRWSLPNRERSQRRPPLRDQSRARGPERAQLVEGTLSVHRDGFGFVGDVFLPPPEARKALSGDKVRIRKVPSGRGRFEGHVVEVIARVRAQGVGIYREERGRAWVEPRDPTLPVVRVPPTQLARPGDIVKVRLGAGAELLGGEGLVGEVSGSLGRPGDPSHEVLSIVFGQGFSDEFPAEVMDEADRIPLTIHSRDALEEGRQDVRDLPLVTIDGADARDFDDAVHAKALPGGGWRLWVAIADVSHYVRTGSALDKEARARGTSVYLPDRVLPMLPERLSNGVCSLKPDEDRLCLVSELVISSSGETQETTLYPGLMRSAARCTYEEVQAVLDGKSVPHRDHFRPHFQTLAQLAQVLHTMRTARGAIDFDLPEHKVRMGEDGRPEGIERRERLESHRLIEACMLAANEAVARFFSERSVPTVYRFHAEPDPDKLATFAGLAEAYGFHLQDIEKADSKQLNAFMRKLAGHPEQRALNQLLLRSMMQAVYSAQNVGHYGLAAEHYLHFTSPIRRYPDLLVHRLLKNVWARGRRKTSEKSERELEHLEQLATHCSERERAAVQAEREVVAFYSALLMKDRVGEEFEGIVSSLTDLGFFVELADPVVEGLVKASRLGPGARLDGRRHALVFPNGRSIRVGQPIRVRLASVNLERRQLDLELAEAPPRVAPESRTSSVHPGFDRLRALASKHPKQKESIKSRKLGKHRRSRR